MKQKIFLTYCILIVAQLIISNYFNLSPYIMLTILPVMVLCLPTKIDTVISMFIAFATGLVIDLFSEGVIGINILALIPVAFCRKTIIRFIFGEEMISRNDSFSIKKNGLGKVIFAIVIPQSLFLFIYLIADGAAIRTFLFFMGRFFASLAAGTVVSVAIVNFTTNDDRK